ncbi:MAG: TIGR01440 family protein [Eubacteriales bacterium]
MSEQLKQQVTAAVTQLCDVANLQKGQILVVGCSTSEVRGQKIGTDSAPETANIMVKAMLSVLKPRGIFLATQCCEHLNRAIVVEREAVPFGDYVNVVPQPKAGGSLSTAAYQSFENPVVLEFIKADAGLDIGGTLIGMHLKHVAVPVRLDISQIGEAGILAARTRPKFIGGIRAHYNDDLL